MRISGFMALAPLCLALTSPHAHAQEGLAGLGAASAMGATLGAAATTGIRPGAATRGINNAGEDMDEAGRPGTETSTITETSIATTRVVTPLSGVSGRGRDILGQLLAVPFRPTPERVRRSPRAQAAYARRIARMSPAARKRLTLNKYRIAPRGYLASYLPADRYKFARAWKYVSTETDRFYYRPQDMARRNFNANRVIGFRTWQDAMLAGYRPDPISKPEPGNQIAFLASLTRDEPLLRYVEYIYAGQVSPAAVASTYTYVRQVKTVIDRNPRVRGFQRGTVNAILEASLTGDSSRIPTQLGVIPKPRVIRAAGDPNFPANVNGQPMGGNFDSPERREAEFNAFRNNAGRMANTPTNP
ncbi:MAG TPA: hypothetical protein VGB45_14235 [Abditibacterium sp.]